MQDGLISIVINNDYNKDGGNVRLNTLKTDTILKDLIPIAYQLTPAASGSAVYAPGANWNVVDANGNTTVTDNTTSFANWGNDIGFWISGTFRQPYTFSIRVNTSTSIEQSNVSAVSYMMPMLFNAVSNTTDSFPMQITLDGTNDDDGAWITLVNELPAYDENGNPYYYWAEEDAASAAGFDVAYRFEDDNSDTTYCIDASHAGSGVMAILNTKISSSKMPSTGGVGTGWYTTVGVAIMSGSAAACWLMKRRQKRSRMR